jgi:hypothetical protein
MPAIAKELARRMPSNIGVQKARVIGGKAAVGIFCPNENNDIEIQN